VLTVALAVAALGLAVATGVALAEGKLVAAASVADGGGAEVGDGPDVQPSTRTAAARTTRAGSGERVPRLGTGAA
jgi:hypothetical protein